MEVHCLSSPSNIPYATDKASAIVRCIQHAVGDGIKEATHGLKTKNGRIGTLWDIMNTWLSDKMIVLDCIAEKTRRSGSWEIVSVFDPDTGFICHVMRETRLKNLLRLWVRGKELYHYARCSASIFNLGRKLEYEQGTLFDVESSTPNEEFAKKTTSQILSDLKISEKDVKGHFLVAFESQSDMLMSVRAVMYNEKNELVAEEKWSKLIDVNENSITESSVNFSDASNNPSHGLELTGKALERKKDKLEIKIFNIEQQDNA